MTSLAGLAWRVSLAVGALVLGSTLLTAGALGSSTKHHWVELSGDRWRDNGGADLQLQGRWQLVTGRLGSLHAGQAVQFREGSMGRVPSRASLDPGRRTFAVAVVFRIPQGSRPFAGTDTPNIVQKGLFRSTGQWKLQLSPHDGGQVQCRVKGSDAAVMLTSSRGGVGRDGAWHTAACARFDDRVVLVVDGVVTTRWVHVGKVRSASPMTVGNRALNASSDQFRGVIDTIAVARAPRALALALSAVG